MFAIPQFKNNFPLTKADTQKVLRKKLRGQKLYLYVDLGPTRGYAVFSIIGLYQKRSQNQGTAHPEGYLLLESPLFRSDRFRYDIASGRCQVSLPSVGHLGSPYRKWSFFPALLFQPCAGSEEAQLMQWDASRTEARDRLYNAILKNLGDVDTIADVIANELKLKRDSRMHEPGGTRIVRYLPHVDGGTADALRELVLARGTSDRKPTALQTAA